MSSITKIVLGALVQAAIVLLIGSAVLSLLAVLVGWLLPLATAGALAPGFIQAIAILTLAFLARVLIFK